MALGHNEQTKRTTFLNIKDGKIYARTPDGKTTSYGYVEGVIKGISVKDRKTNAGAPFKDWFIEMADPETNESYTLAVGYRSGTMVSIVLSLASDLEHIKNPVRIEPYTKGQYTNVSVFLDGVKLDWVKGDLPAIEYQEISGQRIKNDAARLEYIHTWVNRINDQLNK